MQILITLIMSSVFFLTGCSKKSGGNTNSVLPILSIPNITQPRPISNTNFRFYITLNNTGSAPVSVHYTTVAGTALPNTDFIPISGDVSIPAGSQQNFIDVQVIGDSLRQADKQFSVQLSAAQNCTLASASGVATIDNSNGTYLPTDNSGYTTPSTYPGMSLVWSDEFSGSTLDQLNWNYEIGGNGWGNQELENYTSRLQNSFVSNGNLIIEARQENLGSNNYTSARLTTKGKKEFKFGRIDIRAKLPVGKGIWPALWMLGANISTVPWPACGETDIMELIGITPSKVYGTLHFANASGQ